MKFKNTVNSFTHGQRRRIGVLLTNLGTPKQATTKDLRNYLRQFLSDPRVIEVPRLIWWCILHFIILRIRPSRSAKAYREVWTDKGSPLALYTASQAEHVRASLQEQFGDAVEVDWAMRYGEPSIPSALQSMMENGVNQLLVLPLYPQYSASTTASTFDAIADDFKQRRWLPELRFINMYHDREDYISALAGSISKHVAKHGQPDKLIFSYHGVPLRYLHNGDPYHCYCHQTTRLVVEKMQLADDSYLTTFQSRFGREPWLKPYTDETLKELAKNGVQSVAIICPGFSSDCLETLEEIEGENREYFVEAGGSSFHYIPALNDSKAHIDMIVNICSENISSWVEKLDTNDHVKVQENFRASTANLKKESK